QLDRLAEEASLVAEGLTGIPLHDSPRSLPSQSPTSPSARSNSAPSRTSSKSSLNGPTRLQQLLPDVPEDDDFYYHNPLKSPGLARAPPPTPMSAAHPLSHPAPRSDSIDSAMSHSSHATNQTATTGLTHSSST